MMRRFFLFGTMKVTADRKRSADGAVCASQGLPVQSKYNYTYYGNFIEKGRLLCYNNLSVASFCSNFAFE